MQQKNYEILIKKFLIYGFWKYFAAAVRFNKNAHDCTNAEIISFIKNWLVRSKDRFNNNKNKTIPEEVENVLSNNRENTPNVQESHDA